mgnify:CR=1 FL=1
MFKDSNLQFYDTIATSFSKIWSKSESEVSQEVFYHIPYFLILIIFFKMSTLFTTLAVEIWSLTCVEMIMRLGWRMFTITIRKLLYGSLRIIQQTHINIPRSSIKRSMAERLAKIWFITTKKNAPTLKVNKLFVS